MRFFTLVIFFICGNNGFAVFDKDSKLSETRQSLGEEKPLHALEKIDPILVKKGREIFFTGKTTDENGNETELQAEAFRCYHCHNVVKEDPGLAINDPETRLSYAKEKNLPFTTGTTMYGSVNRTTWFNGDYIKKYGPELIGPAHKNFKNAVQLCSKECSKGRELNDWELKAMLNFLWSIEYKLGDLNLSSAEYEKINNREISKEEKLALLDEKYLKFSGATFAEPPGSFETGYGHNGDPKRGKEVFERACLHCHAPDSGIEGRLPRFKDERRTYRYLFRLGHLYGAPRKGEFESEKVYMPNFTQERLSDKQLDDLKAYIETKVNAEEKKKKKKRSKGP